MQQSTLFNFFEKKIRCRLRGRRNKNLLCEVESMVMRVYRSALGRAHFSTFRGCFWRNSTGNGRRLFFPEQIFSSSLSRLRFCTKVVQGQDQGLRTPFFPSYFYIINSWINVVFKIGDRLNPIEVRASASNATPKMLFLCFTLHLFFTRSW